MPNIITDMGRGSLNAVAFIIDPVNEVIGLFNGNPCRKITKKIGVTDKHILVNGVSH